MCWSIFLGRKITVFLKVWWCLKNSVRSWQPLPLSSTIIHHDDASTSQTFESRSVLVSKQSALMISVLRNERVFQRFLLSHYVTA